MIPSIFGDAFPSLQSIDCLRLIKRSNAFVTGWGLMLNIQYFNVISA